MGDLEVSLNSSGPRYPSAEGVTGLFLSRPWNDRALLNAIYITCFGCVWFIDVRIKCSNKFRHISSIHLTINYKINGFAKLCTFIVLTIYVIRVKWSNIHNIVNFAVTSLIWVVENSCFYITYRILRVHVIHDVDIFVALTAVTFIITTEYMEANTFEHLVLVVCLQIQHEEAPWDVRKRELTTTPIRGESPWNELQYGDVLMSMDSKS